MTQEKAEQLLEKENVFLKDGNSFLEGIQLLSKYGDLEPSAQHDIIYVARWFEEMPQEEILQLSRWGFHIDNEDSWAYFT